MDRKLPDNWCDALPKVTIKLSRDVNGFGHSWQCLTRRWTGDPRWQGQGNTTSLSGDFLMQFYLNFIVSDRSKLFFAGIAYFISISRGYLGTKRILTKVRRAGLPECHCQRAARVHGWLCWLGTFKHDFAPWTSKLSRWDRIWKGLPSEFPLPLKLPGQFWGWSALATSWRTATLSATCALASASLAWARFLTLCPWTRQVGHGESQSRFCKSTGF